MIEAKTRSSRIAHAVVVVLVTVLAGSCLLPILYSLAVSLSSKAAAAAGKVTFWPVDFTTYAYQEIIKETKFWNSFGISIRRVIYSVALSLSVCVLAAFPLSRSMRKFKAQPYVMWLMVFCMMFSGGLVPWYQTMRRYGFINNVFCLVLANGLPIFHLILIVNYFRSLPKEMDEAAEVDGAGAWRALFSIYIPLSIPVLATVTLFTVVGNWNEFFSGMILNTTADHYPLQTYIQQLVVVIKTSNLTSDDYERMDRMSNQTLNAAKIFISMLPVLAIYPFVQRYFLTGIMMGSVKG